MTAMARPSLAGVARVGSFARRAQPAEFAQSIARKLSRALHASVSEQFPCRVQVRRRVDVERHAVVRRTATSTMPAGSAARSRRRAPSSPSRRATRRNSARDEQHGIAAPPCVERRHGVSARGFAAKASIRRSITSARDFRHVAEQDERAGGVAPATPRRPRSARRRGRSAKSGLCAKVDGRSRERGFDRLARMAGDDDDRARARARAPLPRRMAHQRLAVEARRRAWTPPRRPPRESATRGRRRGRSRRSIAQLIAEARLRPRRDLHQQAADAHRLDVGARDRHAGEHARRAPSRSRSPSASARSRARR